MLAITIKDWLKQAAAELKSVNIDSYRLDAELILCHVLKKDRTYIHANPEQIISSDICQIANKHLKNRLRHVPLAYIFGIKEFYGRNFTVTKDTLIPRPESEGIINLLMELVGVSHKTLIDVGSGIGSLGITAKLELPNLEVKLIDISSKAIKVAKVNAKKLSAHVSFQKSDLLSFQKNNTDIIIANLPYVDKSWRCSPETAYEPSLALFAEERGLELVNKLIAQSSKIMSVNGLLILETDIKQHSDVIIFADKFGFKLLKTQGYAVAFIKI